MLGAIRNGDALAHIIRHVFVAGTALCAAALVTPAAACDRPVHGVCVPEFLSFSSVATHPDGGFVALGLLRDEAHSNRGLAGRLATVRLSPRGEPAAPPVPFVDGPGTRPGSIVMDLTVLADGSMIVLGTAFQSGCTGAPVMVWMMRLDPDGRYMFHKCQDRPADSEHWVPTRSVFYKLKQLSDGRVIAVGRGEDGGDPDAVCRNASVGGVMVLPQERQERIRPIWFEQISAANRYAFYDVAERGEGALLVTGFISRWTDEMSTRCTDDVLFAVAEIDIEESLKPQSGVIPGMNGLGDIIAEGAHRFDTLRIIGRGKANGETVPVAVSAGDLFQSESEPVQLGSDRFGDEIIRVRSALHLGGERLLTVGAAPPTAAGNRSFIALHDTTQNELFPIDGVIVRDLARGTRGTTLAVGCIAPSASSCSDGIAWAGVPVIQTYPSTLSADVPAPGGTAPQLAAEETVSLWQRGALRKGNEETVPIPTSGEAQNVHVTAASGDVDLYIHDDSGRLVGYSTNRSSAADTVRLTAGEAGLNAIVLASTDARDIVLFTTTASEAEALPRTMAYGFLASHTLRDAAFDVGAPPTYGIGLGLELSVSGAVAQHGQPADTDDLLAVMTARLAPDDEALNALIVREPIRISAHDWQSNPDIRGAIPRRNPLRAPPNTEP